MSLYKKLFSLLILVTLSSAAFGQAANSPFSTFGVGEPFGNSLIQNQGMGGTGVSQPMYWSVNNQNPALLVFNYFTVFQAGALLESRKVTGDSATQKNVNGNLGYLITAFPVMRYKNRPDLMRWTTSVALMPFTKSNYKIVYEEQVLSNDGEVVVDTMRITELGSGGLSQLSWSNGIRLHEDWSIGVKASYVFGSITNDYSNFLLNNATSSYIVGIKEQTYVKDFIFGGGLSFSRDSVFRDDIRLSAGLAYSFSSDLKASKNTVIQRRLGTGTPVTSDTLDTDRGSIYIPSSLTVGASISKGSRWSAGAEFAVQDWSEFRSINIEDEGLEKSWKVSLGGEITPDQLAFKNYVKRITYRAGLSYETTPFAVNGNQLKDIGINFGFSLPAGRSSLDWAFRFGKRGDKNETELEETYYKIYFGITFNDQWFIRRKFD